MNDKLKETCTAFPEHQMPRLLSRSFASSYDSEYDEPITSGTEASTDVYSDNDDDDTSTSSMPDDPVYCSNIDIFQSPRRSQVKFQSVEIREYPIIPGDNPACRNGPPLTIAWGPVMGCSDKIIFSVDQYERLRRNKRRANFEDLMIPSIERSDMLKNLGFSRRAIQKATSQASRLRKQRVTTLEREKKKQSFREWKKSLGRISFCKKSESEEFSVDRIRKSIP